MTGRGRSSKRSFLEEEMETDGPVVITTQAEVTTRSIQVVLDSPIIRIGLGRGKGRGLGRGHGFLTSPTEDSPGLELKVNIPEVEGQFSNCKLGGGRGRGRGKVGQIVRNVEEINILEDQPNLYDLDNAYPDDFATGTPVKVDKKFDFMREVILQHCRGVNSFFIKKKPTADTAKFFFAINAWYSRHHSRHPHPEASSLVRGEHYIAFDLNKNNWLRVAVRSCTNDQVTVESLDFGDVFITNIENLRCIRKLFCDTPIQATRAKLQLYEAADEFTAQENEFFKKLTNGKTFSCVTVADELQPITGNRILGVILFSNGVNGGELKLFNFDGRFTYGYKFK